MKRLHGGGLVLLILLFYSAGGDDKAEKCFCKLQGEVDDCSCKVQNVDSFNNLKIYPRLRSLLSKDYFKYFQVNLKRECPFWIDDSRCALRDCHVKGCTEDDLPDHFRGGKNKENGAEKYLKENQDPENCDEQRQLGGLDKTLSTESREAIANWTAHDDAQSNFCELDDEDSADLEYVDLIRNPERYTGYKGASAHRIWRTVYQENCFKPPKTRAAGYGPDTRGSSTEGMCLEKRVFYRMLSGLHSSISVHLTAGFFHADKTGFGSGSWGPNLQEFQRRFGPELTNGDGPQRLKNLYFAYLVELRALAKAVPYLEQEQFFSGHDEEDLETQKAVKELLAIIKSFPDHFDESKLFQGDPKQAQQLKTEFRTLFLNVSRIMDCVGCDKCKLWGKLQVQGMGTALKILFSGDHIGPDSTVDAGHKKKFQLRRTEIVSLFNAFGRLSTSIKEIDEFRKLARKT